MTCRLSAKMRRQPVILVAEGFHQSRQGPRRTPARDAFAQVRGRPRVGLGTRRDVAIHGGKLDALFGGLGDERVGGKGAAQLAFDDGNALDFGLRNHRMHAEHATLVGFLEVADEARDFEPLGEVPGCAALSIVRFADFIH